MAAVVVAEVADIDVCATCFIYRRILQNYVHLMWMTRIIAKICIDELIIMVISFLVLLELIRIVHYCYI